MYKEHMQILEVIRTRDYSRIEEVITSSVDTWSMRQAEGCKKQIRRTTAVIPRILKERKNFVYFYKSCRDDQVSTEEATASEIRSPFRVLITSTISW